MLSHATTLPKWSFGKDARGKKAGMRSCPDFTITHESTTSWPGSLQANVTGGWSGNGVEVETRPNDVALLPAPTSIGAEVSPIFEAAPSWTFGGGELQWEDLKRTKAEIARAARRAEVQRGELAKMEKRRTQREVARAPIARGFGTMERLTIKGGPLEQPGAGAPGPGRYDLQRECDLTPEWSPSSLTPWGKRTEQRGAGLAPRPAGNVGPGEYTAERAFCGLDQPTAKFGHPRRELLRGPEPDPTTYEKPTYVGTGQASSVGTGQRTTFSKRNLPPGPGPAEYYGERSLARRPEQTDFRNGGKLQHPHISDEVVCKQYPDFVGHVDRHVPPGPGMYPMPKEYDHRLGFIGTDGRRPEPGIEPDFPGPGHYSLAAERCVVLPLSQEKWEPADPEPKPDRHKPAGPCDYAFHESRDATLPTAPQPRPLAGRTGTARTMGASGPVQNLAEKKYEELVDSMRAKGYLKPKPQPWVPQGPKWSVGKRRPTLFLRNGTLPQHEEMISTISSFG